MLKRFISLLLVLFLCVSMSGCMLASEQWDETVSPDDADVVHLALTQIPQHYDVQAGGSEDIARYNFSRLVKMVDQGDGSAGIGPDLAESWEISADGHSYTFHLREEAFFHNDKEFESDDVLFTIDRMLLNTDAELIPDSFQRIRGARDVMEGTASTIENLGVFVSDKYTVVIELEEPCVSFLENLTDVIWSIYNRDAESDDDFCTGTGPFIPETVSDSKTLFMKKNEHYFGQLPEISGIQFVLAEDFDTQLTLFTEGRLDIISFDADEETIATYLNDAVCKDYVVADKCSKIYFYCMNQSLAPFSDLNIRKGLQVAIDRTTILNSVFLGQGQNLNGLVPEGMLFADRTTKRLKFSKEDAIEFFTNAGYSEGFGITICQTNHAEEEQSINELVCQQLKSCGINAVIKYMDDASYLQAKNNGTLSMYLACIEIDTKDPDSFIHTCFGNTGNARWSLNYTDTTLKTLVEQSSLTVDSNARNQLYREIESLLIQDDAVIIPMFQIYRYILVNPRIVNYSSITGSVDDISIR